MLTISVVMEKGKKMSQYKVYFRGFAYVEADSADEAMDIYWDNNDYCEWEAYEATEVDEFIVEV